MFNKFVQMTALLNFPIALGMMIPELLSPKPDTLIISVVLAAFLMAMGAALLWAIADVKARAPIIVWNGLVRYVGFAVVFYAALPGMAPMIFVPIAFMDLITATVYLLGSAKISEVSIVSLILGKTHC